MSIVGRRISAWLIDASSMVLVGLAAHFYFDGVTVDAVTAASVPAFLTVAAWAAVSRIGLTVLFGGSVGKILLGLRVVDAATSARLSPLRVVLRESTYVAGYVSEALPHDLWTLGTLLVIVQIADVGTFFLSSRNRALHDIWAGSFVIKHPRPPASGVAEIADLPTL